MDYQKLNKLSLYVKDTTSRVTKKSGDFLELSKLILQSKELKKNLEAIYLELGQLFYKDSKNKQTLNENYMEFFKSIEEIDKKINHLNKKVLKLKDMKLCNHCSKEIPRNSVFCPACGGKL